MMSLTTVHPPPSPIPMHRRPRHRLAVDGRSGRGGLSLDGSNESKEESEEESEEESGAVEFCHGERLRRSG